jgi:hypothetical protein
MTRSSDTQHNTMMGEVGRLLPVTVFIALAALALCRTMTAPVGRNEHMYIAAGYLFQSQRLYTDFSYVQTPLLPMIYGCFFRLTNTDHYLFLARCLTWLCAVASLFLVFRIVNKLTSDAVISVMAMLLFVFNTHVATSIEEVSNQIWPLPFVLLAFLIFISWKTNVRYLICGICIGLAISLKLIYVAAVAPFLLASLYAERTSNARLKAVGLMTSGIAIGMFSIIFYAVRDFDRFVFNNLEYHILKTPISLSLSSMSDRVFRSFCTPTMLLLYAMALLVARIAVEEASYRKIYAQAARLLGDATVMLAILLVGFSTAVVLGVRAVWGAYLAAVVPWLIVLTAAVAKKNKPTVAVITGVALLTAVIGISGYKFGESGYGRDLRRAVAVDSWTGISVKGDAADLRREILRAGHAGKIATLTPIYCIEAGLPIYLELAGGRFPYDAGEKLSPADLVKYHATSPKKLTEFLEKELPAAVQVGFGDRGRDFAREFVTKHSFVPVPLGKGVIYVRPN